jgi:hypothetical protein
MRLILLLTLGLILAQVAWSAPLLEFTEKPYGLIAWADFENAPYPHESRAEGRRSRSGNISPEHYQDSTVVMVVPEDFEPRQTVDLIVHIHGHGNNARAANDQFLLGDQVDAAGVNAILVIPQGPHMVSDSMFGKLDEPGGFEALVREVLESLQSSGVTTSRRLGRIVLMGHSGGYYTCGQVLKNGDLVDHVAEIYLWDATYAQIQHFAAYAQRPDVRIVSIFTGHLAEDNVDLLAMLQGDGTRALMIHDSLLSDDLLRRERVMLIHSDLSHNGVIMDTRNLERWLRTSALAE